MVNLPPSQKGCPPRGDRRLVSEKSETACWHYVQVSTTRPAGLLGISVPAAAPLAGTGEGGSQRVATALVGESATSSKAVIVASPCHTTDKLDRLESINL